MSLESATYISDLDSANPTASDPKSQGDDHIRLVKATVKTTFPNVSGAVTPTHTELNYVDGVTSPIQTQLDAKGAKAGDTWTGTHNFSGADLENPDLNNTPVSGVKTVKFNGEYDNGNSGTSKTVTLANAQKQKLTLTGNVTLTVDFTGAAVTTYQLRLIQDGTGGRTVTWSGLSATRWLGSSSAPAINSAANGETIVNIFYDGTNAVQSAVKVGAT